MAELWTDERLDAALADLAAVLEVPDDVDVAPARRRSGGRGRWLLLAAAAVLVLAVAVVAIAPARDTVARWFGVSVERDDAATARGSFADDVAPIDVDEAIARTPLDAAAFDATPLGRPDAAGIPPEGGVLLSWRDGATTLWVRDGADDVVVVKKLIGSGQAQLIEDLGDYAVLIDGAHVLDTPARRVAAGRVLWWLGAGREWRLESTLDPATLLEVAHSLVAS